MGTEVKYFHSGMTGAPALSGTAGALLSVLDACLVDGFGLQAMTTGAVAGGVATINLPSTPAAEVGAVILVAGATPAALNGEQRVTARVGNSVSFATTEPDGAIGGGATVKMAPLGWLKPHTGTNKRAYKPSAVETTGCLLRVDDTGTTNARAVGYETMTDVDVGTGPFPTGPQVSGGLYWGKSSMADATIRPWVLIGDAQRAYLYVAPNASNLGHGIVYTFGDFVPFKSGDAYSCALSGSMASALTSTTTILECIGASQPLATGGMIASPRSYTGLGACVQMYQTAAHATATAYSGTSGYNSRAYSYPNGPDNGLMLSEVLVGHTPSSGSVLRGRLPGVYHTPQVLAASFATRDVIDGAGPYAGRKLMALRVGAPGSSSVYGTMFVDITGPWA